MPISHQAGAEQQVECYCCYAMVPLSTAHARHVAGDRVWLCAECHDAGVEIVVADSEPDQGAA